ncbi:MAG: hypothetical protein L3J33_00235 [Rhodobacteraceae bacterium]|nr:hypothetical protein [Paracoccaceae bacterium]
MKNLIKLFIVLVLVLGGLRFFFPPLAELGYATSDNGVSAQVMFKRKGGAEPLQIYIEAAEGLDQPALANEICTSLVADIASGEVPLTGISPTGNMEILYIDGGRYFYRLFDKAVFGFAYDADGCAQKDGMTNG